MLVPRLTHGGVAVWDTLAIAEYLNEIAPEAGLLPADRAARAHCRVGLGRDAFGLLQPALGAADEPQGAAREVQDLLRRAARTSSGSATIWTECLDAYGGPFLFGAPTHRGRDVRAGLHPVPHLCGRARRRCSQRYCETIFDWPLMQEWTEGALAEPDEIVELEVEF